MDIGKVLITLDMAAQALAEELVHRIGMESCSFGLYEEWAPCAFYPGNGHSVLVRFILLKHIAERLTEGYDTLRTVLGLSEEDISLPKVYVAK